MRIPRMPSFKGAARSIPHAADWAGVGGETVGRAARKAARAPRLGRGTRFAIGAGMVGGAYAIGQSSGVRGITPGSSGAAGMPPASSSGGMA